MRIFIIWLLVILIVFTGFYVWRVSQLRYDTPWEVALLGPGRTPEQCVARMRPWFEEHEQTMTEIAGKVASDPTIDEARVSYSNDDDGIVIHVKSTAPEDGSYRIEPTEDEDGFFRPRFETLGNGFYTPFRFVFDDVDSGPYLQSQVRAFSGSLCGNTNAGWVSRILGLGSLTGYDGMNRNHPFYLGTSVVYVYYPDGIPNQKQNCSPDIFRKPDFGYCNIALNEKWEWHTQVLPHDFYENTEKYLSPDRDR